MDQSQNPLPVQLGLNSAPAKKRTISPTIDDSLGFLVADCSRYVKRALYDRIAAHGIKGGSWFALRVLWLNDGISQRDLARKLGVMEPWVQELVRSMERDGLIMRTRDAKDRRRMNISLTDKARLLEPQLMQIASTVNAMMLEGFTESEEALLKLLIKRVRDRLAEDVENRGASVGDPSY